MFGYFEEELGIPVYQVKLREFEFNEKTFLIGHGDGKVPSDKGYKRG
jgi:UDP-2,3-diacylglucosamine hydrolase